MNKEFWKSPLLIFVACSILIFTLTFGINYPDTQQEEINVRENILLNEHSIVFTNETTEIASNWYQENENTTIIEINNNICKIIECKYTEENFTCYSCEVQW